MTSPSPRTRRSRRTRIHFSRTWRTPPTRASQSPRRHNWQRSSPATARRRSTQTGRQACSSRRRPRWSPRTWRTSHNCPVGPWPVSDTGHGPSGPDQLAGEAEDEDLAPRIPSRLDHGQRASRVVVETRAAEHSQLVQLQVADRPAGHDPPLRERDRDVARAHPRGQERAEILRLPDRRRLDPLVEEVLPNDFGVTDPSGSPHGHAHAGDLPARDPDICRTGAGARAPAVRKRGSHAQRKEPDHEKPPTHPPTPFRSRFVSHAAATGSSSQNTDPSPSSLSKLIRPPCASTTERAIVRPRPVPGMPLSVASPRKNLANTRSWSSSAMPTPSSRTLTLTKPFSCSATTSTAPPPGEYLMAFDNRLPTTCASRSGSPCTGSGVRATFTSSRWSSLCPSNNRTWSDTIRPISISSRVSGRWPSSRRSASRKSLSSDDSRLPSASMIPR